jgi:hypothetical protein
MRVASHQASSKGEAMEMQSKQFADGDRTNTKLGSGLGVFSIGLGLAELAAPSAIAKLIGVKSTGFVSPALRAFGAREILNGLRLGTRLEEREQIAHDWRDRGGSGRYGSRRLCGCAVAPQTDG